MGKSHPLLAWRALRLFGGAARALRHGLQPTNPPSGGAASAQDASATAHTSLLPLREHIRGDRTEARWQGRSDRVVAFRLSISGAAAARAVSAGADAQTGVTAGASGDAKLRTANTSRRHGLQPTTARSGGAASAHDASATAHTSLLLPSREHLWGERTQVRWQGR